MIRNKRLFETLYECVKRNGNCKGCFYGDGSEAPSCMFTLMNDILFFFKNPVPSKDARVLLLPELEDILADKKDHLCFGEFINTIHVAQPFIRTITLKQNVFTLFDPTTDETDQFLKNEYYTKFRIWSTKPTDTLRNNTEWTPMDESMYVTEASKPKTKTEAIFEFIKKMS